MSRKSLTMKKMSVVAPRTAAFCVLVVTALMCGWSSFSCVTSVRAVLASSGQQAGKEEQQQKAAEQGEKFVPEWEEMPDQVWAVIDEGARNDDLTSLFKVMFSGQHQPDAGAAELNEVRDRVLPETISSFWRVEPGQPITLVEEGLTRWQLFFQAWRRWKDVEAPARRPEQGRLARGRGGPPRKIVSPLAGVSRRFRGDALSVRQPRLIQLGAFFSEEFFATSSEYTANAASQEFASAFLATFEDALARPQAASYVELASVCFDRTSQPQTFGRLDYGFIPTEVPGFLNPPIFLTRVFVQPPDYRRSEDGRLNISALRVQHANIRMPDLLLPAADGANATAIERTRDIPLCTASAADMTTRRSSTSIWCGLLQENHFDRATIRFKVKPSWNDDIRQVLVGHYDLELAFQVQLR
ncbi:unnamed protein product [Amoebophrya sp. A120]|nr:unnamed protein product [Amoebophrya sp. A120]|eukprot:GSA120T00000052001.1